MLYFIFLVFLCPFLAHPELDDRAPGINGRSISVQFSRFEKQPKGDAAGSVKNPLAIGAKVYTTGFYQCHVRLERKLNSPLWPVAANGLCRSPPIAALSLDII